MCNLSDLIPLYVAFNFLVTGCIGNWYSHDLACVGAAYVDVIDR